MNKSHWDDTKEPSPCARKRTVPLCSMNVPDPYARPGQKNRVESLKIKVARKKDINREIIKETVNLLNQKNIRHPVRDIKNTNEVNSNDTYLDNRKMD